MTDGDELLVRLLDRPAAEAEAWLTTNEPPRDFNWRGLAEMAGWNALHRQGDTADAVTWARVARLAHQRLIADAPGDRYEAWRARIADASLRAELIGRHGATPGHPLLDCDAIFEQFLTQYGDQYDEIARDCERWTTLSIERVRFLRYVKNELKVIRALDRCRRFADPEVQRWVQLWPRLP